MNVLEIPEIDLNKELSKCKSMEDLVGKNGLMQRLFGGIIQQFLEAEMEEHLGREKYERQSSVDKNYRNGYSSKNIKTSFGEVDVDVPRDRKAEFEPKIVKKYETVCSELDKKVIGLYARGMSVNDIKSEIDELYGVDISPSMISRITDKVMETAVAWQNRELDAVYPIVYMDAVHFKVRDDHRIVSKAAYICMALDVKGYKDILGIWVGEQEGAKFWLSVCNDLKNRGVKDILIAANYGLQTSDYSTISKKANKVNYKIAKKLFDILVTKCNRATRRVLKLPKDLLAIDSSMITVGAPRLKWAKYRGQRSGVKLHVAFNVTQMMPAQVEETIASKHDGPIGEKLMNTTCILVEDRAYGKHSRFDKFKEEGQSFVIRIKENIHIAHAKPLKRMNNQDYSIIKDITCKLGTDNSRTKNRFRVVEFKDFKGKTIKVCTDMLNLSAEKIADIYKEKWKVETFFRFIKQNLNVKRLFGTSENSVYNQLFCSLIAYILLHFLYMETSKFSKYIKLSFVEFNRKLCNDALPIEAYISIDFLIQK